MLTIPGAFAQKPAPLRAAELTSEEEIKQFCSNIADPARPALPAAEAGVDKLRVDAHGAASPR